MNERIVKIPPNSKESEMMVLGCMMSSVQALSIASDNLAETDFYYTEHKIIFQVLKSLYMAERPADLHIVCEEVKRLDKLKAVGGVSYITSLVYSAGTSAYIEDYVNAIKDKALLRRMINASQTVEAKSFSNPEDVRQVLEEAQSMFFVIGQTANSGHGILVNEIISGVNSESRQSRPDELEEKIKLYKEKGPEEVKMGIKTHFRDLDKMINGLNPSNLIILAARPGMGKTAFAMNVAENVCFKNGLPVGVFSLEMSADQLFDRMLSSQSRVEWDKIRTGDLNEVEHKRVVDSFERMNNTPMIIDDQSGLKITDLRARARRMKEKYNIQFLVIDYLQLILPSGASRQENRQNEIAEISRMLKGLAKELNIPILCLSQLSRKVEERVSRRPMMSDLRESGSIEQDSDIVMFMLRREYYDPTDCPGRAELIVAKNRHGQVGDIDLEYRGNIVQFSNHTPIQVHRKGGSYFDKFDD